jgi:hypothetical protein
VPIAYYGRTVDEGKKIGWRDGLPAVTMLLRLRFGRSAERRRAQSSSSRSLRSAR